MLKSTILWLSVCLILSYTAASAQKKTPDEVEIPKNAAPLELPPSRAESESRSSDNSSSKNETPSNSGSSSSNSGSSNGSNSSSGSGSSSRDREDRDKKSGDRDRDRGRGKNRDRDGKRDDKDGKARDKDRRRKHRDRNRDDDIWGRHNDDRNPNAPPPAYVWFDKNDVVLREFELFTDPDSNNYLPYFQARLGDADTPLQRVYLSQISLSTYPFIELDWAFYYEPDMNELFINFSRFGRNRFERLVLIPLGETVNLVAKQYKDTENRPIIVEDISGFPVDKIAALSIGDLPKGQYSLMLLGMAGETAKIGIVRK